MMQSFTFMEGKAWNNDQCYVISNLWVAISSAQYVHHADLEIERLVDKESWTQEVLEGQHISSKQMTKRKPRGQPIYHLKSFKFRLIKH